MGNVSGGQRGRLIVGRIIDQPVKAVDWLESRASERARRGSVGRDRTAPGGERRRVDGRDRPAGGAQRPNGGEEDFLRSRSVQARFDRGKVARRDPRQRGCDAWVVYGVRVSPVEAFRRLRPV
jgi:hypothetical protein